MHASVTRRLDAALEEEHGLGMAEYGVLITLVTEPDGLRLGELAARQLASASGITRLVDRLAAAGYVSRRPDPQDGRGAYAVLTDAGLRKLREAQVTHHRVVRERFVGRLSSAQLRQFATACERAQPGITTAQVWPPPD